jgi:hypothetical protein
MNSLWWLALPVLLLPVWWHRQKREQVDAEPLATARFLPRAQPREMRVWRWADVALLLVRCLLLACLVAWLADPVLPWRGDTVLVVPDTDAGWAAAQAGQAGFKDADKLALPSPDALGWFAQHEREWRADARVLAVGDVPMPAAQPRFRHKVELRTLARRFARSEHRVAIVSKRAGQWRKLFASLDGPQHYIVEDAPGAKTELVVWDVAGAPPPGLHAPLWWIGDASAFPELKNARTLDGLRYADSPRGRLWASDAWPPQDADAARALFETWQELHYAPVPFTAPPQVLPAGGSAVQAGAGGDLRGKLMMALVALFALERMLTHARRR